jgi:VWFA-related protein
MRLRLNTCVFAAVLAAAFATVQFPAARAQDAPITPQVPSLPVPTRESLTAPDANRVVLNVVVAQKSGPAIGGLAQSDFTVLDNGQPQAISSFKAITSREAPVATLVIIDTLNETVVNVSYARAELAKFLRSENGALAHPMQIAVLGDDGLQLVGGASNDGNVLATQLDGAGAQLRQERRSTGIYGAEERDNKSIEALNLLARGEIGRPGRKLVILLSPGWALLSGPDVILETKTQQKIMHDAAQLNYDLRMARITLYDVDPLGTQDAGAHAVYYKNFVKGLTKLSDASYGDLGLQVLVEQSGGLVLTESNDVAGEIRRCLEDASNYYELSYDVPAAAAGGGKTKVGLPVWHKVESKMAAQEQTARSRPGYYVLATP